MKVLLEQNNWVAYLWPWNLLASCRKQYILNRREKRFRSCRLKFFIAGAQILLYESQIRKLIPSVLYGAPFILYSLHSLRQQKKNYGAP